MRDVAGDEDEIERPLAGDLVGDVDVTALCVLDVRDFHAEQCPLRRPFVQRLSGAETGGRRLELSDV